MLSCSMFSDYGGTEECHNDQTKARSDNNPDDAILFISITFLCIQWIHRVMSDYAAAKIYKDIFSLPLS